MSVTLLGMERSVRRPRASGGTPLAVAPVETRVERKERTRRAILDVQLAHRRQKNIRPPAVDDQMNLLYIRTRGQGAQEQLQMRIGEFARLPVMVVPRASAGPSATED